MNSQRRKWKLSQILLPHVRTDLLFPLQIFSASYIVIAISSPSKTSEIMCLHSFVI